MMEASGWIRGLIAAFLRNSPDNSLRDDSREKAWDDVLVGFSRGDDPLFPFLKDDIGSFFWTPREVFSLTHPELSVGPEELTVISWILLQTKKTKADNRKQKDFPAERWVRSRNYGEAFNVSLARHLVEMMADAGIAAVAPGLSPYWQWQTSERYGLASNWSERHIAYVSGLGTFGLCDGLITPKGKALRCGSVVVRISVPPTPRPYEGYRAHCLFFAKGTCRKCIDRCPAGAISESGHDKAKCREYLFETVAPYAKSRYGIESYGCGLCQTAVPCESRIPLPQEDGSGCQSEE